MALHGHVQRKAQEEIDAWRGAIKSSQTGYSNVCEEGRDELPSYDEMESETFPYLTAVLKEVLRYAPVGPLGKSYTPRVTSFGIGAHTLSVLPHKASQDDEYEGYTILKDTTVIANVWYVSFKHIPFSESI